VKETLGRKPTDADYGLGEHLIDVDRMHLIDEAELTERLVRTFSAPSYHPPRLPAVATELLELSHRADASFQQIEALLAKDVMLAGEILAIARSAFYSGSRPVQTLQAALVRIGLTKLREVVVEAAMNLRVFRSASYSGCMERLRRHSVATANLCRILSRYAPVTQDRAFLCGLLHDVGIAGVLLMLGESERGKAAPDLLVLWPAIDAAHARAGARMVTLWKLPDEIATIVAAHHQVSLDGVEHPMAATVCLAEELAVELGLGFVPPPDEKGLNEDLVRSGLVAHGRIDRSDLSRVHRAREVLKIDDAVVAKVLTEAREWAAAQAEPTPQSRAST
jgi:putative nucleotidyltransferase with HDIG domain